MRRARTGGWCTNWFDKGVTPSNIIHSSFVTFLLPHFPLLFVYFMIVMIILSALPLSCAHDNNNRNDNNNNDILLLLLPLLLLQLIIIIIMITIIIPMHTITADN